MKTYPLCPSRIVFVCCLFLFFAVSCSQPEQLTLKGAYVDHFWDGERITVQDHYAYVSAGLDGLLILDVSDLENPLRIGQYDTIGYLDDFEIANGHAYLATDNIGVEVLDLSNPYNPDVVDTYHLQSPKAMKLILNGDFLYFWEYGESNQGLPIGAWHILNVSDPSRMQLVHQLTNIGRPMGIQGSYVYAYRSEVRGKGIYGVLQVIDISNPVNPEIVYEIHEAGSMNKLVFDGSSAFSVSNNRGLIRYDISNPTVPRATSSYSFPTAASVAIHGNFAYLLRRDDIQVLDISDPAQNNLVANYDEDDLVTNLHLTDIFVSGDYLYVTDPMKGLFIFNTYVPEK